MTSHLQHKSTPFTPKSSRAVRIESVQEFVAAEYGLAVEDLRAGRRGRSVAGPRQIAMYLSREFTGASFPKIGLRFGRHHTTVMHAVQQVELRQRGDEEFSAAVIKLRSALKARLTVVRDCGQR